MLRSSCQPGSRSSRALEGAALGAFIGLVAGATTAGIARLIVGPDSNDKSPMKLAIGLFSVGLVSGMIVDAIPSEC